MAMPAASTASRTGTTGGPALFGPSPETSITCRRPSKPLPSNSGAAKASAPEIEVPRIAPRGASARPAAKAGARRPRPRPASRARSRPASRARPFDIGDGDPAVGPGADGGEHLRVQEGLDIALALQRLLVDVHRARDVDREHELEIDRGLGGGAGRAGRRAARPRKKTAIRFIAPLPPRLASRPRLPALEEVSRPARFASAGGWPPSSGDRGEARMVAGGNVSLLTFIDARPA